MIINNIQDYGDAILVTSINQRLQRCAVTVVFVDGHLTRHIVTPAQISFKLANGHQF